MFDCTSAPPHQVHHAACGCAQPGRRVLLGLAAAALGAAALPRDAGAASGTYDAMLLNCIDPRFTTHSLFFMASQGMRDKYSQFVVAGGPIGAVHPRFAAWHAAFWENLAVSVQLHSIKRVVALTHRDCGAAKLALGDAAVATREAETLSHGEQLRAFRAEAGRRQPALAVTAGIMDLDGSVQLVN